jgi:hypothetical protein
LLSLGAERFICWASQKTTFKSGCPSEVCGLDEKAYFLLPNRLSELDSVGSTVLLNGFTSTLELFKLKPASCLISREQSLDGPSLLAILLINSTLIVD